MFRKLIFLSLLLSMPVVVNAEVVTCDNSEIVQVYVQGKRDDSLYWQNSLVIQYKNECGGKNWTHTDIDSRAMSGFLSVALTAKTTGKKVNVAVNTSNPKPHSNELAFIGISD
ncbi:hypothetical protein L1D15_12055 [Vibrio sp. Isolate25]|uniref:hypothetical protein n=1 Tax=unclassified Vibrio TaxID=2614977 RepID=UPI001EFCED6A|nr:MULTISPECIES: hypothetical protein [unclassified Vibrio]MCG9597450.1 hypothetical protein [Vibrio sp. Isolate25]MCG9678946.1 hypothetical protein [Vibrio sp. Isolate24]